MTELVVQEQAAVPDTPEMAALKSQIRMVVNTDFVPKHLRGNPHACLAAVLYGKEIGLGPMESLNEVHIVDGKPSLSAKCMTKLVRQHGHSIIPLEISETVARVRGKRRDTGDEHEVAFTADMAKRAGLTGKTNYKSYPEDMLWARAVSRLCRRLFADVVGALAYSPEEAEGTPADAAVEAVDALPIVEDEAEFEPVAAAVDVGVPAEPEPLPLGSEFERLAADAQARKRERGE